MFAHIIAVAALPWTVLSLGGLMAPLTRAQRRSLGPDADKMLLPDEEQPGSRDGARHRQQAPAGLDLRGDRRSLALLLLLYTLQGVPMGLAASVTFLLQEKGVTYSGQGACFVCNTVTRGPSRARARRLR